MSAVPIAYHVRPGDRDSLQAQLRISLLEELASLRRRALAWEQYGDTTPAWTAERIHAIESALEAMSS